MAEKVQTQPRNGGPHAMVVGEKSKNFKKAFLNLYEYMGKYKWFILVGPILAIIGSVLNLVGPGKISEMTNMISAGLTGEIDVTGVVAIATTLAFIYGLGFLFNYAQGFMMTTLAQIITKNMRKDISEKINRMPLRYFDKTSTGNILSIVTNDVDTVGQTMNQSFSMIVSSVALLVGSMFMMFRTNAIMAIAGILAAIIGFMAMIFVISKSQKFFSQQQKELGGINGLVEETYTGHTIVKAYNAEKLSREEFHQRNERLYNCAWKSQFLSGLMMPLMGFIGNFAYVIVCIVGAVLALQGIIPFGTIVAFMLYIRIFTQPLQNLSQAAQSMQSMAAACERVFEFLKEEELSDESHKTTVLSDIHGDVAFENVRFGYDDDKTIIRDFSCEIKAGQKIAIVGPTGAGKTTMVNLLMRFYEINSGKITIDGVPVSDLTRTNIHDLFGMVLQDTWMFEGTVRDNLLYSKTGISDARLDEICKATGLYELIQQLPNGYDTVLGDKTALSSGQKQLITIARAMVEDAPLLILDEATSSVDTRTELQVQKAMDTLTEGRTSFVIAHRLSTIKNADCILVMKDGDIIESGNHDTLISQGGFYADLYNSQFEQAS